jgi:hypothetical protein
LRVTSLKAILTADDADNTDKKSDFCSINAALHDLVAMGSGLCTIWLPAFCDVNARKALFVDKRLLKKTAVWLLLFDRLQRLNAVYSTPLPLKKKVY